MYNKNSMKKFISSLLILSAIASAYGAKKERFFAYRSFQPEAAAMRAFGEQGIDLYAVMPSNTFNSRGTPYCMFDPFWVWDETYLWTEVDKQFELVIHQNPRAKFICLIDINSPIWLSRRMTSKYGFGGDSFNNITNTLCMPEWKELTSKMVQAYVKHMEERFGDRVFAYIVAGGGTSEWYCRSKGYATEAKRLAWKKWLKEKKLPDWEVPTYSEIFKLTADKGSFADPEKQRVRIEYGKFSEQLVIDGMDHFSTLVRNIIGDKKQVGAFCGYIPGITFGKVNIKPTYESKCNDFIGSPGEYDNRAIGMGGFMPDPLKSLRLQGKHWFQEIDHRTHTYNYNLSPYVTISRNVLNTVPAENQAETTAMLKREFALATILQNSLWCFDMWGGVFSTPETMKLVGTAHKIWQRFKDTDRPMNAEILHIVDPASAFYVNWLSGREMVKSLTACGAPIDQIFFDDIAKVDMSKYKMVVLSQSFEITPEKKELLNKYVFKDGKFVVTMSKFGVTDGKKFIPEQTKELTGFEYKQKGINVKKMGNWTSIYADSSSLLDTNKMREFAIKAGVHMYTDYATPVYANEKLVAVHTKLGGKKTVYLTRKVKAVKELFTDKIVAENVDKFEYDFLTPDTALFELID